MNQENQEKSTENGHNTAKMDGDGEKALIMDSNGSVLVCLRTNSIDKRQLSINFSVAATQISCGVLFLQNLENFAKSRLNQKDKFCEVKDANACKYDY